jgi:hypothetical protein
MSRILAKERMARSPFWQGFVIGIAGPMLLFSPLSSPPRVSRGDVLNRSWSQVGEALRAGFVRERKNVEKAKDA